MKVDAFTPWQLRTIRAMALDQGVKVDTAILEFDNKEGERTGIDMMHRRVLGDYRDMLAEMVIMIEDYAKEHGGI